jgi:hypothetical protein
MIGCPQCGAELTISEQEVHPSCPFCGTAFLLDGARVARHLLVPAAATRRQLLQAVRDHLARGGIQASRPFEEPDLLLFLFPYRRRADGATEAAFVSHVRELREFRLPGSDWKVFHDEAIPLGAIVLEPSEGEAREGDAVVHYPVARAAARLGEEELVLWLDAARGRVLGGDLGAFRPARRGLPAPLLAGPGVTYLALMLLLPLPWSLAAALAATPLLHRWGMRRLREPG